MLRCLEDGAPPRTADVRRMKVMTTLVTADDLEFCPSLYRAWPPSLIVSPSALRQEKIGTKFKFFKLFLPNAFRKTHPIQLGLLGQIHFVWAIMPVPHV